MAYLPLSTANLPNPAIDPAQGSSPQDYFDTLIWSGAASNQQFPLNFTADFVWAKRRNGADSHVLYDIIRGENEGLQSNSTSAETTNDYGLDFIGHDYIEVESTKYFGTSGNTFVGWNWKANGSGSTIAAGSIDGTNPTIASQVSANTESGFSIVSYTGNGVLDASIGHGLSQAPEFIIIKNRDASTNWPVYTTAIDGGLDLGYLNLTNTFGASTQTLPTDSVFHVASHANFNANTQDYIAYCFHSVDGFSKLGSYTGNGSTDGPFVYCGFKAKFILTKSATTGWNWQIHDTERDSENPVTKHLYANLSNAEVDSTTYHVIDFLSNGFKLRSSYASANQSGQTFIYMAFAENPFKFSTAS